MSSLVQDGAFTLGSGLVAGVLAIGTLPIWEDRLPRGDACEAAGALQPETIRC